MCTRGVGERVPRAPPVEVPGEQGGFAGRAGEGGTTERDLQGVIVQVSQRHLRGVGPEQSRHGAELCLCFGRNGGGDELLEGVSVCVKSQVAAVELEELGGLRRERGQRRPPPFGRLVQVDPKRWGGWHPQHLSRVFRGVPVDNGAQGRGDTPRCVAGVSPRRAGVGGAVPAPPSEHVPHDPFPLDGHHPRPRHGGRETGLPHPRVATRARTPRRRTPDGLHYGVCAGSTISTGVDRAPSGPTVAIARRAGAPMNVHWRTQSTLPTRRRLPPAESPSGVRVVSSGAFAADVAWAIGDSPPPAQDLGVPGACPTPGECRGRPRRPCR